MDWRFRQRGTRIVATRTEIAAKGPRLGGIGGCGTTHSAVPISRHDEQEMKCDDHLYALEKE